MAKTSEQTWQRVRTGIMSAALLKPIIEQVLQSRKPKSPLARLADQVPMPLSDDQLEQIENIARLISDRALELTEQSQKTLRKADKRVWWASGLAVGFAAAGAVTFFVVRRRMQAQQATDEGELIAIVEDVEISESNGYRSPIDQLKSAVSRVTQRQNPGTASQQTAPAANAATAVQENPSATAPFVGNAHTMVYHPSDSPNLPAENNRVYFKSREEAEKAGYRPAENE